jgi:hypothetical protein
MHASNVHPEDLISQALIPADFASLSPLLIKVEVPGLDECIQGVSVIPLNCPLYIQNVLF